MSLSDEKLQEIFARHAATTRGPWRWFGHGGREKKQINVYLATTHSGHVFVMDFERSGMHGAAPRFHPKGRPMKSVRELVTYEVEYRDDVSGIANPDAIFIENSWADVADLLDEVDRLRALLADHGVL
jgi:hypothetical protein